MTPPFDAVVLAGGRGRRLGGAVKPEVLVAGRALVDHALAAVAGAARVVLVAPESVRRPGVPQVLEDPPDGGPVAGIAAGLDALGPAGAPLVVVLACDVPRAAVALPDLLRAAAGPDVDGARLVAADGSPQHLVAAYRRSALVAALAGLDEVRGASVKSLLAGLRLADVSDVHDAALDADTWADVARLNEAAERSSADADAARPGDASAPAGPGDRGTIGLWTEPPTRTPTDPRPTEAPR